MKGYEKEKKFILVELKERTSNRIDDEEYEEEELPLEKYDAQKSLEGIRVQDDDRKLKYAPSAEEGEDELFFDELPNIREDDISDQFRDIYEQPM